MNLPFSSQTFFNVSMAIYLVCSLGYLIFAASRSHRMGTLCTYLLLLGLLVHSGGLVLRWVETHQTGYGYVPLSNMYESLVFFSWTIILIYLILEFKYRQKIIGVFVTPFAFLAIALTSSFRASMLRSLWCQPFKVIGSPFMSLASWAMLRLPYPLGSVSCI
jgi:ABC-type transport system involved in cytochrome c biogenesis permease subunit